MTQSNTEASSLYEKSSKGYCVGLGFSVWCIRSKPSIGNISAGTLQARASVCLCAARRANPS